MELKEKMKSNILFKVVSIALVISFSFYDLGFSIHDPDVTIPDISHDISPFSVYDIGVPIRTGTVRARYSGPSEKVIVHIQDAHCNFEAQSNISNMLEQLSREAGIDMISVEGAEGIVDTAWFRAFPDAEIRREVATYFMKRGEITGAEFFSINYDYNGSIFGAETREHYLDNLKAFLDVYPHKDNIQNYLDQISSVAARLKTLLYHPELRELDSTITSFRKREMELSEFAGFLDKACSANGIDKRDYHDFNLLTETLEFENKIDFDIVDNERARYIDTLSDKLSREEMAELVAESIRFKKGYIKAVDFYSHLRQLARDHDIPIVREYPNLFYYHLYTRIYDRIEIEALFKDLDAVGRALKERLIRNEDQRDLDMYSEKIDMLIALTNIELTNEDYDRFSEYSSMFSIEDVLGFFSTLTSRYNLNVSLGRVPHYVTDNLPNMVAFYEIAIKRDNSLVENTLRKMEESGRNKSVLIAGGFHTRGIENILRRKGVSYVVLTPKITKDVDSPYIRVLTNQRTSIEDIITESSAMPGTGPRASMERTPLQIGDLLSPLLRFGWGITLYLDRDQRAGLRELSEDMASEGIDDFFGATVRTFEEAVDMLTRRWIEEIQTRMQEQLGMQPIQARAEFRMFLEDQALWDMLTSAYLSKYDDYWREIDQQPSQEVRARIVRAFEAYRADQIGEAERETDTEGPAADTPGIQEAGRILTPAEKDIFDQVIGEDFDARLDEGKIKIISLGELLEARGASLDSYPGLRPDFNFVVHEGLMERLAATDLPNDVLGNIHPGRGGEALSHSGLQAHIDSEIFQFLTLDELLTVARHETAHLEIFEAQKTYEALDRTRLSEDVGLLTDTDTDVQSPERLLLTTLNDIHGEDIGRRIFDLWQRWVTYRPSTDQLREIAQAQEDLVNSLPGHDVSPIVERISGLIEERSIPAETSRWTIDRGDLINGTEDRYKHTGQVVFRGSGQELQINDEITILGDEPVGIPGGLSDGRALRLVVAQGTVEVAHGDTVFSLDRGSMLPIQDSLEDIRFVKRGPEPAVLRFEYDNNERERFAYGAFDLVKEYADEVKAVGKINVIAPSRMFARGDRRRVGSAAWYEEQFARPISDQISINSYIHEDLLSPEILLQNAIGNFDPDPAVVNVLYATQKDKREFVRLAETNDEYRTFLQSVKIRPLPDNVFSELKGRNVGQGLMHAWEAIAVGLLQAAINPETFIVEHHTPGSQQILHDLRGYFNRARREDVPEIQQVDMYGLLSYDGMQRLSQETFVIEDDAISEILKRGMEGFLTIVNRLLMNMPIRPFNPADQLHQRLKVLWSA